MEERGMEGAHPGGVVPGAAGHGAKPARGGAPLLAGKRAVHGHKGGVRWGRGEQRLGK